VVWTRLLVAPAEWVHCENSALMKGIDFQVQPDSMVGTMSVWDWAERAPRYGNLALYIDVRTRRIATELYRTLQEAA